MGTVLTKENLKEWRTELDGLCVDADYPALSDTLSDEDWLEYAGTTPEDYLNEEIRYGRRWN